MRIEDYGKLAATFVDTSSGRAVRIFPRGDVREKAFIYYPNEPKRYQAQLRAYQIMPDHDLLLFQPVRLTSSVEKIVSRRGVRTACELCGEEIINQREIRLNGRVICRACASTPYYTKM